jgi:hypothetical protein
MLATSGPIATHSCIRLHFTHAWVAWFHLGFAWGEGDEDVCQRRLEHGTFATGLFDLRHS